MINEVHIIRPEIALNDFLPIFVSSTLVLVFGLFYVAIYTLVKMKTIKSFYMPFAYLFWVVQVYCMYYFAMKIGSESFTIKVLMFAMFAYLFVPHLYYKFLVNSEKYSN